VIVIDASALTKFILKEEGWEEVISYLKAGTVSVDLVVKEVANAIWKTFKQEAISIEEAKTILKALKEIVEKVIKIEEELNYVDEAIKIAFSRNITIYDSLYIAMAKIKGLNLLTIDETQANVAKAENITAIILK
jgi:predicted nucleic acid-binding protein